jgi:hypothetical protein
MHWHTRAETVSAPAHLNDEYLAYIRDSPVWRAKRRERLEWAGYRCQVCNSPNRLDVHHRTYERFGGAELPADLTVLCRACHDLYHEAKRQFPGPLDTLPEQPVRLKVYAPGHRAVARNQRKGLERQRQDSDELVALLRAEGPLRPEQVAYIRGWTVTWAKTVANLLKRNGRVHKDHGHYCLPGQRVGPARVPESQMTPMQKARARERRSEERHLMPHLKGATRR